MKRDDLQIFKVAGDNMNDGTCERFEKGCYVLAKPFNIEVFKNSIANDLGSFWVIDTDKGYLLWQINEDVKEGCIICHSLNPEYQDIIIKLEEITNIWRVMESQTKVIRNRG